QRLWLPGREPLQSLRPCNKGVLDSLSPDRSFQPAIAIRGNDFCAVGAALELFHDVAKTATHFATSEVRHLRGRRLWDDFCNGLATQKAPPEEPYFARLKIDRQSTRLNSSHMAR